MQLRALPLRRAGINRLRTHKAIPELHDLLMRPHVVAMRQPGREGAHESAALGAQRLQESLSHPGFHEHVVVEVEHGRGGGALQQEVALLGDAVDLRAAMPFDGPAADLDDAAQGLDDLRAVGRLPALVGDDHVQIAQRLRRDPG